MIYQLLTLGQVANSIGSESSRSIMQIWKPTLVCRKSLAVRSRSGIYYLLGRERLELLLAVRRRNRRRAIDPDPWEVKVPMGLFVLRQFGHGTTDEQWRNSIRSPIVQPSSAMRIIAEACLEGWQ